ncbi:MAG: hypothetical protein HPY66_2321 [Firmicutes bacterium]|nr:hypothetical protein [Bacillota bacterium]
MKNRNMTLGIILIAIGVIWMLNNLGYSTWFLWEGLFKLWPLILVIVGISVIFRGKGYIITIAWLLFFASILGYGILGYNVTRIETVRTPHVVMDAKPGTSNGKLSITLDAGNFTFNSEDSSLLRAYIPDPDVSRSVDFTGNNSTAVIDIKQTRKVGFPREGKTYNYEFGLNKNLSWEIDVNTGAMNGVIDLSDLDVSRLDLNMGAGNIKVSFGDISRHCEADLNSGASNIHLVIPEGVGTRIKFDGVIKNSNLNALNWEKSERYYTSPNYSTADKKLDIDLNMGVGRLTITDKNSPS